MKTRIFTLIMSLFIATMAFAYDAQIDGIYYNFDETNKTAEVTQVSSYYYSDIIIIPEKVNCIGVEYIVTSIGESAFYNRSSFTSITIPNSVTSIGRNAFRGCSSLTSITIPNSVTSIEGSVFAFCSSLTSVQWNAKKCSDFDVDYSSPFYYCEQITSFTFGDNVEHIPAYLCYKMSKLTSITISNSVTSIGDEAFRGCSSLTSISIPNSVTSIEYEAFRDCSSLTSVYISDIAAWCNIEFGNYDSNPLVYAENLYLNNTKVTDLVIPEGVDSIKDYVFFNCSFLTSITIPNSVTSIGNHAFEYCSSLTSITLSNSVTSIGSCAFEGCSSLISVTIPNSVTSIGDNAFYDCSSLTSITIPNSVTEFGYDILYDCNNIQILNAPAQIFNQVTEIEQTQFSNKLTEVHITDGELDENGFNYINRSKKSLHTIDLAGTTNTVINDLAFYDCYKLENLMLPGNLETIGFKAFADCAQLKAIKFPSTLKVIQDLSFANCTKIDTIQVDAIVPPIITSTSFDKVSRDIEFIVPEEAREAYAEHEYWKEFMEEKTEIENVVWNVEIYTRNGTLYIDVWGSDYQVFDVNGRLVYTGRDTQLSLPRGVYVVVVEGEVEKVVL